jgi:CRP-like cAMP-binding protein
MHNRDDRLNNALLACLSDEAWARWRHMSDVLALEPGQSMDQGSGATACVYFPLGAVVALHAITEEGAYSELAVVGSEGMVGISGFMGGGSFFSRAIVLKGGPMLRISAVDLRREVQNSQHMLMCALRYTQALVTHIAQTGVCNRHHSIDQALRRWLLMSLDRVGGESLHMTHELMARLLGVRREGITEAAARLQHQGLIRYARGRITVTDRDSLARGGCECYQVVKSEYERLLDHQPIWPGLH